MAKESFSNKINKKDWKLKKEKRTTEWVSVEVNKRDFSSSNEFLKSYMIVKEKNITCIVVFDVCGENNRDNYI